MPCPALDPIPTSETEKPIDRLSGHRSVGIVIHNMQQAARVSHITGVMYHLRMIEYGAAKTTFATPGKTQTKDCGTGRFG